MFLNKKEWFLLLSSLSPSKQNKNASSSSTSSLALVFEKEKEQKRKKARGYLRSQTKFIIISVAKRVWLARSKNASFEKLASFFFFSERKKKGFFPSSKKFSWFYRLPFSFSSSSSLSLACLRSAAAAAEIVGDAGRLLAGGVRGGA